MKLSLRLAAVGMCGLTCLALTLAPAARTSAVRAADDKGLDQAALERTRTTIKMLDDLYKNAVVSITNNYVAEQSSTPAAAVAKEVFAAMHKNGWHHARLVDATGRPKNKANSPKTDFEKKAVAELKGGKKYYEEIAEADGKPVLRAATVVPPVLQQCLVCHGRGSNGLLGAIIYEVPIK